MRFGGLRNALHSSRDNGIARKHVNDSQTTIGSEDIRCKHLSIQILRFERCYF